MVVTATPACDNFEAGYCVKQGPEWIAGLLYNPPWWLYVIIAAVVVSVAAFAYFAHQKEPLSKRDARDALGSITIVLSILVAVLAFRELLTLPYLLDALGGWAVGGFIGIRLAGSIQSDDPTDGEDLERKQTI